MLEKYKVVYKGGQDEIIEKKSRFIATVAPVESEEEALAFIDKVGPEKTYLTHISHNFGFHQAVQNELPKNVFLAYDNLEITI